MNYALSKTMHYELNYCLSANNYLIMRCGGNVTEIDFGNKKHGAACRNRK